MGILGREESRTHRDSRGACIQRGEHMRTQGEGSHPPAREKSLRRNQTCSHLDPGLPPFRTVRNKVLFFKPFHLRYYYGISSKMVHQESTGNKERCQRRTLGSKVLALRPYLHPRRGQQKFPFYHKESCVFIFSGSKEKGVCTLQFSCIRGQRHPKEWMSGGSPKEDRQGGWVLR